MKKGEELIEIKILISRKSFFDFVKKEDVGQSQADAYAVYDLLSKHLDIKELECHTASVARSYPQLYVVVSGNGTSVTKKGWRK